MAQRYFKKYSPGTPAIITLSGAPTPITFDTLDHVLGWYGSDNEAVTNELARLIREQRGGITEVSAEEYHEHYAQKKMMGNQPPLSPWREELSRSAGLGLVNREVIAQAGGETLAALAVSGKPDSRRHYPQATVADPPGDPPQAAHPSKAPVEQQFKPTLGKRNQPNAKGKNQNSRPAQD